MSGWHLFLICWLALSGLIIFVRGCARMTRTYSMVDAVLGLVEILFLIWIVAVKL